MKTIELVNATGPLVEYARGLREEPLILTEEGRPVAALVPIEDADLESLALSTNPQFIALIEHSRARQRKEGGISPEEMRHRLGIK